MLLCIIQGKLVVIKNLVLLKEKKAIFSLAVCCIGHKSGHEFCTEKENRDLCHNNSKRKAYLSSQHISWVRKSFPQQGAEPLTITLISTEQLTCEKHCVAEPRALSTVQSSIISTDCLLSAVTSLKGHRCI